MSLISMRQALFIAALSLPFITPPAMGLDSEASIDYAKTFAPSDPVLNLGLNLSQSLNKMFKLTLSQDFAKNMVVDSSKDEWEAADTRFGLKIYPKSLIDDVSWVLTLSATLPSSKESRQSEIYSKPEIKLGATYQPLTWLKIRGNALARYYIEKYTSAPTHAGEGGGPLPDHRLGVGQGTDLELSGFTLGYDFNYTETNYHKLKQAAENNAHLNDKPDQGYNVNIHLSRELWTDASLSLNFSQGTVLAQEGWEDYVLFDKEQSTWGVGFSQGF